MSLNLKKFKYVSWEISHVKWRRCNYTNQSNQIIKLWNRRSHMCNIDKVNRVIVYKGNKWISVKLHKLKNSFKVGSFAFTRKPFYYPLSKKKGK